MQVGIINLSGSKRLPGIYKLRSGRHDEDPELPIDRNSFDTHPGDHADFSSFKLHSRLHDQSPFLIVFTRKAVILQMSQGFVDVDSLHPIIRVLLHDNAVRAFRDRRAGHNAHGTSFCYSALTETSRKDFIDDFHRYRCLP